MYFSDADVDNAKIFAKTKQYLSCSVRHGYQTYTLPFLDSAYNTLCWDRPGQFYSAGKQEKELSNLQDQKELLFPTLLAICMTSILQLEK
jgi:hypothetical protein